MLRTPSVYLSEVERAQQARKRAHEAFLSRQVAPDAEYLAENPYAAEQGALKFAADSDAADAKAREAYATEDTGGTHSSFPEWRDFFGQMNANKRGAAWDGKDYRVDYSGFGNGTTSRVQTNAPRQEGGDMAGSLAALKRLGSGTGGGFDVTDDPRVQQRLIQEALTALEPDAFGYDAGGGQMHVGSRREVEADRVFGKGLDQLRGKTALEDELEARFAPRKAGRELDLQRRFGAPMASAEADAADVTAERGAQRAWMPYQQSLAEQNFNRRRELSVMPAQIAAEGRQSVVDTQGQTARDVATLRQPDQQAVFSKALSDATRAGTWGLDEYGKPNPPPKDIQDQLLAILQGRLAGGGPAGGGSARAQGAGPVGGAGQAAGAEGDVEGLIQDTIENGLARDRADAIQQLRKRGFIR